MRAVASGLDRPGQPELLGEELLRVWARQGRRVPYPVALSALVIALMAGRAVSPWLTGGWVVLVLAVLGLRAWLLSRLPQQHTLPVRRRLQVVVALGALNGLVFAASLAFAPLLSDYERMVQTILLLGLCAGSVATAAGYLPVLLSFVLPVSLANSLAWVTGGGGAHAVRWVEWMVGGLILAFAWILIGLARDVFRVFDESVAIRQQQVQSNEQLRVALAQAESAVQAKTRFLAAASHDLRQPMHTLSLFGAALVKRPLDAVSADMVMNMNLAVQALASQMDAVLDISKLDAQVLPVRAQVFALGPWLAALCAEFQPAAQRKGLHLRFESADEAALVETDPLLLERLLRNLIDNAIKYTQHGGVEVRVQRNAVGCDIWRIVVRDSGCGIASGEQARVFEEFYQVGNAARDRSQGLGLGLSIVTRLVDLLDLHLDLHSAPGEGSSFSLSIAAAELMPPSSMPLAAEAKSERLPPRLPPRLRVLVLDDEEPIRLALQALLLAHGCEVTCTASTREALVKTLIRHPDIVLADLRLQGGDDGISAVRSLRGALPGLPAVLITGDLAADRLHEAQAAGLVLLHKPVREELLLTAMLEALAARASETSVGSLARAIALEQEVPPAWL